MSAMVKPTKEKEVNKQRQKLNEAGFRGENAPAMFNTLKSNIKRKQTIDNISAAPSWGLKLRNWWCLVSLSLGR